MSDGRWWRGRRDGKKLCLLALLPSPALPMSELVR